MYEGIFYLQGTNHMKNFLIAILALTIASASHAEEAKKDSNKDKKTEQEKPSEDNKNKSEEKSEEKPEDSKNPEDEIDPETGEKKEKFVNDPKETMRLLEVFGDVLERVKRDYVEEPSDKKLIESAINGMLTELDPHSSFMNDEEFKDMKEQTKGEFGGLGIEVTMKNGLVYVVSPIDDTPAFKAGLKAGDYISDIDDVAVMGMTIGEAVKKMRGKVGEKVKLKIVREGEKKPFDVEITRDTIKVQSVKSKIYDDVGYIRITSFTEKVGENAAKEIERITKEVGAKKLKGFVLDLRNDPGGLLNEAISVSDIFLDSGEIVSTRGRHEDDSEKYSATAGDLTNGAPVVVLINGGSASASEIVSGALQDHKRAVIIGEKSFGKGSVQTVIPLPKDTAIRLTTSRYYTPSGRSIQAKGIEPDIIVEQAELKKSEKFDRTTEANLKGHLDTGKKEDREAAAEDAKNETSNTPETAPNADADKEKDDSDSIINPELFKKDGDKKIEAIKDPKKTDPKEDLEKDYQLMRAVDLVRGLAIYSEGRK
jgi:carboxyl-terminal processing protease